MAEYPITFQWDGDAMVPSSRMQSRRADEQFVIGETYVLEIVHERSAKAHNYFFSRIAELHTNLPHRFDHRFPTPQHLRKWVLVRCGYYNEIITACDNVDTAIAVAAMARSLDGFAVITVSDAVVRVCTAKSQRKNAMKKDEFNKSSADVLEFIEQEMIGGASNA